MAKRRLSILRLTVVVLILFTGNLLNGAHCDTTDVLTGTDLQSNTVFNVQGATFQVVNTARKFKDETQSPTLNFTLKGTTVKPMTEMKTERKQTEISYEIPLEDSTMLHVTVKNLTVAHEVTVLWDGEPSSQDIDREICFNMDKDVKWFNTYQQYHQQWPIDTSARLDPVPFNALTKESTSEVQHIAEALFFASTGFVLQLDWESPLFYKIVPPSGSSTTAQMCFSVHNQAPYNLKNVSPDYQNLGFTLYAGVNLKETYQTMANVAGGIKRPAIVPEDHMFAYPIWKVTPGRSRDFPDVASLTSDNIVKFAIKIKELDEGLKNGVISLDSWWAKETEYLKVEDSDRIHDIKTLVKQLNGKISVGPKGNLKLSNKLQLVVSPYVHKESKFARVNGSFLVQDAIVSGNPYYLREGLHINHGLFDFSNDTAKRWFVEQLKHYFQNDFDVASFVFDAVETHDEHLAFAQRDVTDVPGQYAREYASVAAKLINRGTTLAGVKEVRDCQQLPLFVHMSPRLASWTDLRGIKSLIPTALALSLAGYSFIVPDVVGGSEGPIDDSELYTRWAQVTSLMPAMQFITPPWQYNDATKKAVKEAIILHTKQLDTFRQLANKRVLDGTPLMRPMWWVEPTNEALFNKSVVDTQFMLGDDILVAPILEQGSTHREVYFPSGSNWIQQTMGTGKGELYLGNGRSKRAEADLGDLLWFTKQK